METVCCTFDLIAFGMACYEICRVFTQFWVSGPRLDVVYREAIVSRVNGLIVDSLPAPITGRVCGFDLFPERSPTFPRSPGCLGHALDSFQRTGAAKITAEGVL